MTTINDLSVASSFSPDDKVPMWQNANGVTRALPLSVLTAAFLTAEQIQLLQISPATETFVAGIDFTPGTSLTLTLANTYGSAVNLSVHFDANFQGPEEYSLLANTLTFSSPIPVGVNKVYVHGGVARLTDAPTDGSVTSRAFAPGAVNTAALADGGITGPKLNVSGAGVFQPTINFAYNPSGITTWTPPPAQNFEGLSVDIGNYGARGFGSFPNICSVLGAINIPASASLNANGCAVAGYVKNKNATSNSNGVALFGQADVEATNSLVWGLNTVSQDNGFATTLWGAEIDLNVTNVNTVAFGVNIVGGSSVEPPLTFAIRIGPLGTFGATKMRWQYGLNIEDGAVVVGAEMPCAAASGSSGSVPFVWAYNNGAQRLRSGYISSDPGGNMIYMNQANNALVAFQTTVASAFVTQFSLGNGYGFGTAAPSPITAITGSKGGNAALASLISYLAAKGMLTDSTT